ncbi:NADP-dependent phosphogluconate dehydrogenase, partial [Patescibacteria group bacterium]|nr:NADP-dependent phosphogluconate dehydrogenase [Patescibacteria group bacterium]
GYNRSLKGREKLRAAGVDLTDSMDKFITKLGGTKEGVQAAKKIVWLMLPAGQATDDAIFGKKGVLGGLSKGDILIDGANAYYKDTARRARILARKGIKFLDAGVSGGPSGALNGACVMIGGEKKVFREVEYLFKDISAKDGYKFFDGAGAGHFVKMVHNGIEYGMMQAIAEGFNIMKKSRFKPDLSRVAEIYNNGSVIESRLIGWLAGAFKERGQDLNGVSGKVGATGEGAWTVQTAKEMKLKAKIIEESLKFRKNSQKSPDYTGKILAALREQFGGHSVK